MANFSTVEALSTLCTSIPDWNARLDELNGQIALRQIELARLTEKERPPTRSLKNKGSTESLRPKDDYENPFGSEDSEKANGIQMNPFDTPRSNQNGFTRPTSSAAARAAVMGTPPPPKVNSGPRLSPGSLKRNPSQPTTPAQGRTSPAALRKRKTGSIASGESIAPKYKTRSMIIVYYDSAVQTAFEDLVKFVSGSRNSMRKGKMAAKMAEMKRAAELEIGDDDEDDDGDNDDNDGNDDFGNGTTNKGNNLLVAQKNVVVNKKGESLVAAPDRADSDSGADMTMPKLNFVSTRQMGPSRGMVKADNFGSPLGVGMLRGYRRGGGDGPDIFDELDKGLEWCQGQCEHAAHQFLRDGECSTEIENIKKRLGEVKATAEKEIEKLKKEAAEKPKPNPNPAAAEKRSLQMKTPIIRREALATNDLEVDDMEVDDEGVDDLEPPPKLIFKRSRDVGI